MPAPERRLTVWHLLVGASTALLLLVPSARAQVPAPNPDGPKANWALFDKYSSANLRGLTYSTDGHAALDRRDRFGLLQLARPHRRALVPGERATRTKKPLFDHAKLAAQLSVLKKKAVEAFALNEQFTQHEHHQGPQEPALRQRQRALQLEPRHRDAHLNGSVPRGRRTR